MPPRKKPTEHLGPKQHRVCFIVKWTNDDPRMGEMMSILIDLCKGLTDNHLADDTYLTIIRRPISES
jgi:hypothetical protein